jgi:hypothetical protein
MRRTFILECSRGFVKRRLRPGPRSDSHGAGAFSIHHDDILAVSCVEDGPQDDSIGHPFSSPSFCASWAAPRLSMLRMTALTTSPAPSFAPPNPQTIILHPPPAALGEPALGAPIRIRRPSLADAPLDAARCCPTLTFCPTSPVASPKIQFGSLLAANLSFVRCPG